jgi:Domain of unknown function (DUF4331)
MKINYLYLALAATLTFTACDDDDDKKSAVVYEQEDQMARPAINTVFIAAGTNPSPKDVFNETIPSAMASAYNTVFADRLDALNGGITYPGNALGQTRTVFANLLATDVMNVALTGETTFYNPVGPVVLTGRKLGDDVIDTELLLIFGGTTGASNPGLTSDNVDGNDKLFLTTFPYLAAPF